MTYYWHRREFPRGLAAFSTAYQGDAVFVGDEQGLFVCQPWDAPGSPSAVRKRRSYPAGVTIAGHGDKEVRPAKTASRGSGQGLTISFSLKWCRLGYAASDLESESSRRQ
jgi:hypothetical protein